jgi:two-component system, NtrC family, response regulator PilR
MDVDRGRTVLVIEDHGGMRRLVRDVLGNAGYDVAVVASCSEAKRLLTEHRYALVISNVVLPDGLGTELVDVAAERGTKVLLVTGHMETVRRLAGGPTPLIVKPFKTQQLRDTVAQLIGASG